jgi:cobyrinic acid a,c-diamide synthase
MARSGRTDPKNQRFGSLLISSPQGHSGKTTVTLGLCHAFKRRGLSIQPFKKGPDYIDPSWLTVATGRSCRNLDPFLIPKERLIQTFCEASRGVDLAIVEGAMGLYDGLDSHGTTAEVARLLGIPILLVVNAARMTTSIAAMVSGYQQFQKDVRIAGVILNYVSGKRHEKKLREAVEQYCGIPVVGSLPRDPGFHITERHLGLIPSVESGEAESLIEEIGAGLEPCFELDAILEVAHSHRTPMPLPTLETVKKLVLSRHPGENRGPGQSVKTRETLDSGFRRNDDKKNESNFFHSFSPLKGEEKRNAPPSEGKGRSSYPLSQEKRRSIYPLEGKKRGNCYPPEREKGSPYSPPEGKEKNNHPPTAKEQRNNHPLPEREQRNNHPPLQREGKGGGGVRLGRSRNVKIGVLRDRAFNFYYPENLEALSREGAELLLIDSLRDRLPKVDGIYIGGGFPEFSLKELEANRGLRKEIASAVERGLPVYAECGGLMYLCRGITWQGRPYEMVGTLPAWVELSERPQGHGYVVVKVTGKNPWFSVGQTLRGHEFHHSSLLDPKGLRFAYLIKKGRGIKGKRDGVVYKNLFASYVHLHASGTPGWARSFVSLALAEKQRRKSKQGHL